MTDVIERPAAVEQPTTETAKRCQVIATKYGIPLLFGFRINIRRNRRCSNTATWALLFPCRDQAFICDEHHRHFDDPNGLLECAHGTHHHPTVVVSYPIGAR